MFLTATVLLLALTRAEIIERFKSPVVTQSDGLVRVYADCPEDMRREFQSPIARFAADTVLTLYQGLALRPLRFANPGIIITVGDVRTNSIVVLSRVTTNDAHVVSHIRVVSPGYADLDRLRIEVIKGFYRSVRGADLTDVQAIAAYRHANPELRISDDRIRLENWLAGCGTKDDEEGIALMRRVFQPGQASRRDVLIFASRLFLYPPRRDLRLAQKFDCLSFREAVRFAKIDPLTRLVAYNRANELPIVGGGRGDALTTAAEAYRTFLLEFAVGKKSEDELLALLDDAETKLNMALEKSK